MPNDNPCQLDRLIDPATRTLADLEGIRFLYMDGQPSDSCKPDISGGWHTVAVVSGANLSADLREDEDKSQFFPEFPLRKWAGSSMEYRTKVIEQLAQKSITDRIRIHACSYREDTVLRAWPKLRAGNYRGIDHKEFLKEYVNGKNQAKMVEILKMPRNNLVRLNSFIPLFVMAEHIDIIYRHISRFLQDMHQNFNGLLVLSDRISGDDSNAHPKITILNDILQCWRKDSFRVKNYDATESKSGEFLADNIAGILNTALIERLHPWRKPVRQMIFNNLVFWYYFDKDGNKKEMRLSKT